MCERYISDGLEQDTAYSPKQFYSFYLQDHKKSVLKEIGDIKRFSSPAKLLSFAGSEPSVYQSGKFSASSGKMVKRGSPYLRWALLQAARTVPKFSLTFASYFNKKRNEGKHYCVAASHCAKKLIRIIFALLNNNSSFSDNFSVPAY